MIFIGISTWSWCYALWSSLAFPHDLDATLYDLHWHFHMILMLRSMIFNCNSTHPHPIVWGGVAWDDNVIGISTWSWCYALWSSLAFPHDLDATLYDLHWHFHMIWMLRSNMEMHALFPVAVGVHREKPDGSHRWHVEENVRKSCSCPFSGWSHGRVVIHKVDGPFFWRGFEWKKSLLAVTK